MPSLQDSAVCNSHSTVQCVLSADESWPAVAGVRCTTVTAVFSLSVPYVQIFFKTIFLCIFLISLGALCMVLVLQITLLNVFSAMMIY